MELETFEKILLSEFLGSNWGDFIQFAEDHGFTEDDCDNICSKLEGV